MAVVGITPFLSIVRSRAFRNRAGNSTLIYSVPNKRAAVYAEELKEATEADRDGRLFYSIN